MFWSAFLYFIDNPFSIFPYLATKETAEAQGLIVAQTFMGNNLHNMDFVSNEVGK